MMADAGEKYTVRIESRQGRPEPIMAFGTPFEIVQILANDYREALIYKRGLDVTLPIESMQDAQDFMRRAVKVLASGTGMIPAWFPMVLLGQEIDILAFLIYMASIGPNAILTILGDDAPQAEIVDVTVVIL